jgi:hypothetical protein
MKVEAWYPIKARSKIGPVFFFMKQSPNVIWDWFYCPYSIEDEKSCGNFMQGNAMADTAKKICHCIHNEVFCEWVISPELWVLQAPILNPCDFCVVRWKKNCIWRIRTLWKNFKEILGMKFPLLPYSSFDMCLEKRSQLRGMLGIGRSSLGNSSII